MFRNFEGETRDTGAGQLVANHVGEGHSLGTVGSLLRQVIPFVISKSFTPAASSNVLAAELADLITAMDEAYREGAPVLKKVDGGGVYVAQTQRGRRRSRSIGSAGAVSETDVTWSC